MPTVYVNKEHDYTILVLLMNLFLDPSLATVISAGTRARQRYITKHCLTNTGDIYLKFGEVNLLASLLTPFANLKCS